MQMCLIICYTIHLCKLILLNNISTITYSAYLIIVVTNSFRFNYNLGFLSASPLLAGRHNLTCNKI